MIKNDIQKVLGIKDALIEEPREKSHGDYSTNVALVKGKDAKRIVDSVKDNAMFSRVEVAGPGFINFFLSDKYLQKQVGKILKSKEKYGDSKTGKGIKVNVEFISANPTGPLTLGNGRGGFGGDVLSNVLEKSGYEVTREFYVNDRGKQVGDLAKGLYKGEKRTVTQIQKENQKTITKDMGIKMNVWFSENSLYKNKEVDKILNYLDKKKLTYKKEGALWLKTTKFEDDKDRVLIKANGDEAYFLSDIAYLKNKLSRGHKKLVIFLGADHHGYVRRMKSAMKILGYKKDQLDFIIMQMVAVMWEGETKRMSKREGIYWGIDKLIKELGLDVVRFFFLNRGANSHLIFDLDLAKEKSAKNPVYYVQYAHARISSILAKSKTKSGHSTSARPMETSKSLKLLDRKEELELIKELIRFEEVVENTASDYQLQRLPQYAIDLAESFHRFYQNCQVISDDKELTKARLALVLATQIILKNTLSLMGISAPDKM